MGKPFDGIVEIDVRETVPGREPYRGARPPLVSEPRLHRVAMPARA